MEKEDRLGIQFDDHRQILKQHAFIHLRALRELKGIFLTS